MTSLTPDIPRTYRPGSNWTAPRSHRWFDEWLVPAGEPLAQLATGMREHVKGAEKRRRIRTGEQERLFAEMVAITTANLALAVLDPPQPYGRIAIRAGNMNRAATRYDNPAIREPFRPLVDVLHATGFLDFAKAPTISGEASSIAPTHRLADLVQRQGVSFTDFGRHHDEELLMVKRDVGPVGAPKRERVDYRDTPETDVIRAEMRTLNAFLREADITFEDDGLSPMVNATGRTLRRHFFLHADQAPRFDQGGRLFGGFWVNLASRRRQSIRIDGEPVADLDFKSMFARLAYAEAGVAPPEGDLYAFHGLEDGYRSGAKLAMNTLFWDKKRLRRNWPEEMGVGVGSDVEAGEDPSGKAAEYEGRLPAGWTYPKTKAAMEATHPALKPLFGRGVGGRLMFKESAIMLGVLRELRQRGTVALPLHDGLMVPRSRVEDVRRIMERVAREMTGGLEFPVEEKTITTSPVWS